VTCEVLPLRVTPSRSPSPRTSPGRNSWKDAVAGALDLRHQSGKSGTYVSWDKSRVAQLQPARLSQQLVVGSLPPAQAAAARNPPREYRLGITSNDGCFGDTTCRSATLVPTQPEAWTMRGRPEKRVLWVPGKRHTESWRLGHDRIPAGKKFYPRSEVTWVRTQSRGGQVRSNVWGMYLFWRRTGRQPTCCAPSRIRPDIGLSTSSCRGHQPLVALYWVVAEAVCAG